MRVTIFFLSYFAFGFCICFGTIRVFIFLLLGKGGDSVLCYIWVCLVALCLFFLMTKVDAFHFFHDKDWIYLGFIVHNLSIYLWGFFFIIFSSYFIWHMGMGGRCRCGLL